MKFWNSMGAIFKIGSKEEADKTAIRRIERKRDAYNNVFGLRERADDQDKEIVLSDLAELCGLHAARNASDCSTEQLWQDEGRRQVMLHILDQIDLPEADLRALRQAARREAAVNDLDNSQAEEQIGHDFS